MKTLVMILTLLFLVSLVEAAPKKQKMTLITATGKLIRMNPNDLATGWGMELTKPIKISRKKKIKFIEIHTSIGQTGFTDYFIKYTGTIFTVKGLLKKEGDKCFILATEIILGE